MKRKIFISSCIVLFVLIAIFSIVFFNKQEKPIAHEEFAKKYIEYFIKDNPFEQFKLTDVSKICNKNISKINYKRSPLVEKNYSVSITNTREATDTVLKKINNVYASYCKAQGASDTFKADKAYRYNVKIKNKGKQIYNVSFWVVEKNKELSVCTIYEYERSLDRCFVAGMY